MKNIDVEKVLLFGPSPEIGKFSKEKILYCIDRGYSVFSFGDSIRYLLKIGIVPNYHTFLDPNTWCQNAHDYSLEKSYEIDFLAISHYKDSLKKFNSWATCNVAKEKHRSRFNQFINLKFTNNFNNVTWVEPSIKLIDQIKQNENIDFKENFFIFGWSRKKRRNSDKFSCYTLPLIINHFENLNEIHSVGFGDIHLGRYVQVKNKKGLGDAKQTFDSMAGYILKNISKHNIKITFENNNYYCKKLSSLI